MHRIIYVSFTLAAMVVVLAAALPIAVGDEVQAEKLAIPAPENGPSVARSLIIKVQDGRLQITAKEGGEALYTDRLEIYIGETGDCTLILGEPPVRPDQSLQMANDTATE